MDRMRSPIVFVPIGGEGWRRYPGSGRYRLGIVWWHFKAAGVAITTATVKAATVLIAAGKSVTARTVHVVVDSWPTIKQALSRAGMGVCWWYLSGASFAWVQGNCILCGQRTPDGHFGDIFCSGCARRIGQFFGLRP
jgi:hypothetical protein